MTSRRTLDEARRILEEAERTRSIVLHPHARQHQIPIKDIEAVLADGTLGYGQTPAEEAKRYTLDLALRPRRHIRLVFILDANPAFCRIISAYEKW